MTAPLRRFPGNETVRPTATGPDEPISTSVMLTVEETKGPKRGCHATYSQLWAAPTVGHATAKQQVTTVITGLKARAICFMLVHPCRSNGNLRLSPVSAL